MQKYSEKDSLQNINTTETGTTLGGGGANPASRKGYAVICGSFHSNAGVFGIFFSLMVKVIQALEAGYIPVIDTQHYENQYFKEKRVFKDNIWEYFFKQPANVSLKDLENFDNIEIFSIPNHYPLCNDYDAFFQELPHSLEENKTFKHKKLYQDMLRNMNFSDDVQKYISENAKVILNNETEVLGILCRGTDYLKMRPWGHYIQPEPEMLIKEAKELKKKYNCKKIYLATEDLQIYNQFKKEFGDILLPNTQYMYGEYKDADKTLIGNVEANRQNHQYKLGIEYINSIYILSHCKYLIGGHNGAAQAVYLLSEQYKNMEYVHIWERGKYKVGKKAEYLKPCQRIFSIKNEFYENIHRKVLTILGIKFKFIKDIK